MFTKTLLSLAIAVFATSAAADPLFASFDNFNYFGTVTRYATLADAQTKTNAVSGPQAIATAANGPRSTLTDARDATLYVGSGHPDYYATPHAQFGTAWYYTTTPINGAGSGNPNNTNPGFVQYVDAGPLAAAIDGGWSNGYSRFTVSINGGAGDDGDDARLWPAPASSPQNGLFRSFDLNLVADFAAAATLNGSTGWYENTGGPTAVSGSVTGIFENDSATASLNGFYAFDFGFALGSWAAQAGATYDGVGPGALFAAPEVVPEPGTLALAGLGLLGLAGLRRRR